MDLKRFGQAFAIAAMVWVGAADAAKPAQAGADPKREAQVVDLAKELIAIRSVRGPGNQTAAAAGAVKAQLIKGGWSDSDVEIVPVDDTVYMIATWRGSDPSLKPLVISGHLDVVEAKPSEWDRDPFTPVVENGYLFGRGASDMKFSAALSTVSLVAMRQAGFKPRRTIILEFSGDEETTMKTSRIIAERLKNAEMVLNLDSGEGSYDEATGKPLYWSWEGAEKTYDDYQLEVTNPGGHSSQPAPENAIYQLAQALSRVGAFHFPAEQNPLTKGYFEKAAAFETDPALAAAMKAFAANPQDQDAVAVLRKSPFYVGKVGTTCVATLVSAGHAQNALPQRARANINCRVFPGHSREEIRQVLERVIAMPEVKITAISGEDSVSSPASPMRPDLMKAMEKAIHKAYPGVAIIPGQSSGASDSMWSRVLGVPSYGVSPLFIKAGDDLSHGLNERIALTNTAPGLVYCTSLFSALSR